ncbi:MAG: 6-carboxytetrahydropterin synthase [Acidobacteriota bacterium]
MKLTSRYMFSASHRLHSHELSEQQNWDTYGRCNNQHGHGHNYSLEVTLAGSPDTLSGLLCDRDQLDRLVEEEILSRVRHVNLNEQVAEFGQLVPTTENVAFVFTSWLKQGWSRHFAKSPVELDRVRIYETRNNRFEIEANEVKQ